MKAIKRIERVKHAWNFTDIVLDLVAFASNGRLERAFAALVYEKLNGPSVESKQPAKVSVKSERGPGVIS